MENTTRRVTQRAPQACQRCSAKKMRCSKTVPCDECISQGMAVQCRREGVIVTKQIRSAKAQQQRLKRSNQPPYSDAQPEISSQASTHMSPSHRETAAMLIDLAQQTSNQDTNYDGMINGIQTTGNTPRPFSQYIPSSSWAVANEEDTSPSTNQDDASPFETTLNSLEFMVWGRQRDTIMPSTMISLRGCIENSILSPQQASEIIEYHYRWLAWTHNFIHWPRFREECQLYWNDGLVKEKAWLALYYAVLCVRL